MAEIEYPKHILPKVGWRVGITGDDIRKLCENAVIGRRMDGPIEDYTEQKLGELCLKINSFRSDSIPNLSTSLLGTVFRYEDFRFKQKEKGKDSWDGVSESDTLISVQNYEKHAEKMSVIGWEIKELDGLLIPYTRNFPKESIYDEFKKEAESLAENVYIEEYDKLPIDANKSRYKELVGKVILRHMPTNLNYWHFTIDLFPSEDVKCAITNAKSAWKRMMADNVRDILCKNVLIISKDSDYPSIPNWEKLVKNSSIV